MHPSSVIAFQPGPGLQKHTVLCISFRNSVGSVGLKKKKVQNFLGGGNQTVTEQFEEDKILCTYVNIYLNYIYTQHTQSFTWKRAASFPQKTNLHLMLMKAVAHFMPNKWHEGPYYKIFLNIRNSVMGPPGARPTKCVPRSAYAQPRVSTVTKAAYMSSSELLACRNPQACRLYF